MVCRSPRCFIPSFVEISPLFQEKKNFEWFYHTISSPSPQMRLKLTLQTEVIIAEEDADFRAENTLCEHVRIMKTPYTPLLYKKTGVKTLPGYTFFFFFL